MSNNKQLLINFIAMVIAFIANAGINFFLSGYIVNTVSEEAYGFIQLANTFVTYFTIITIAINSMSSRYIAIEYYKKALKIFKYNYSKDHHQLRSVADNLYRMYLKTGDTKDAEDIKKEYFF